MTCLLGTTLVEELTLHLPSAGCWRADVTLTAGELPTGKVTLTAGSATFIGTVQRAGDDLGGGRPHATVLGGIGWDQQVIRPLSFQSDAGVRLSTVLAALSRGSGEPIEQPKDQSLDQHYELIASRPHALVRWADALNDLVQSGYITSWRVDPDGVTRFGERTPSTVTGRATLMRKDGGIGLLVYGLDDPLGFLPNNTIEGLTISRLSLHLRGDKFEAHVYQSEALSSPNLRETIRRIAQDKFDQLLRTYVVASTEADGRLNLTPPTDAPHLPELGRVEQWTMGGAKCFAKPGAEVLVLFRDRKGTRPVAVAFAPPTPDQLEVTANTSITIGKADTALYGARRGDLTSAGGPGTMCTLMPLTGAGLPPNNAIGAGIPCLISFDPVPPTPGTAAPLYGTIMTGSNLMLVGDKP